MSRTTDYVIGMQEGTLTKKEKLVQDPTPMYSKYHRLFKATELYRKADGMRKGVDDGDPRAIKAFGEVYEGSFGALDNNISRRCLECLSVAQLLSNDLRQFGEEISPELLIVKIIQEKPKVRRKLKQVENLHAVPLLSSLDLA